MSETADTFAPLLSGGDVSEELLSQMSEFVPIRELLQAIDSNSALALAGGLECGTWMKILAGLVVVAVIAYFAFPSQAAACINLVVAYLSKFGSQAQGYGHYIMEQFKYATAWVSEKLNLASIMDKAESKARDAVASVRTAVAPALTGASEAMWRHIEKLFEYFPSLPSRASAVRNVVMNAYSPLLHGLTTSWNNAFFTYIFRLAGGKIFSAMFAAILGYICGKRDGGAKEPAALAMKIKRIMRQEDVQKTLEMAPRVSMGRRTRRRSPRSTGRRSPRSSPRSTPRSTPRRSSGRRSPRHSPRSSPRSKPRSTPRRSTPRRKSPKSAKSGGPAQLRVAAARLKKMGVDKIVEEQVVGARKSPAGVRKAIAKEAKLRNDIRRMNTDNVVRTVESVIMKKKSSPSKAKSPKRRK
jgi:hypothetical protein